MLSEKIEELIKQKLNYEHIIVKQFDENNQLKQDKAELQKALIESIVIYMENFDDYENCEYIQNNIQLLEKQFNKSWEEIKDGK